MSPLDVESIGESKLAECFMEDDEANPATVPSALLTVDISIEFEFLLNFVKLLLITYSTDHKESLHTSRQ